MNLYIYKLEVTNGMGVAIITSSSQYRSKKVLIDYLEQFQEFEDEDNIDHLCDDNWMLESWFRVGDNEYSGDPLEIKPYSTQMIKIDWYIEN